MYLRLYKSVQDYSMEMHSAEMRSNSNLHSSNTLFSLKRGLKKYWGNENLSLAWDRIKTR